MICKSTVRLLRYNSSMSGETLRINSRNILAEIINDNSITINLERGIYNYTIWIKSLSTMYGTVSILQVFIKIS